jgi:hypothetical protein
MGREPWGIRGLSDRHRRRYSGKGPGSMEIIKRMNHLLTIQEGSRSEPEGPRHYRADETMGGVRQTLGVLNCHDTIAHYRDVS